MITTGARTPQEMHNEKMHLAYETELVEKIGSAKKKIYKLREAYNQQDNEYFKQRIQERLLELSDNALGLLDELKRIRKGH